MQLSEEVLENTFKEFFGPAKSVVVQDEEDESPGLIAQPA